MKTSCQLQNFVAVNADWANRWSCFPQAKTTSLTACCSKILPFNTDFRPALTFLLLWWKRRPRRASQVEKRWCGLDFKVDATFNLKRKKSCHNNKTVTILNTNFHKTAKHNMVLDTYTNIKIIKCSIQVFIVLFCKVKYSNKKQYSYRRYIYCTIIVLH